MTAVALIADAHPLRPLFPSVWLWLSEVPVVLPVIPQAHCLGRQPVCPFCKAEVTDLNALVATRAAVCVAR